MSDWYLYVIRCRDGTLYTGISTDVDRRFTEHQRGGHAGSKYLKGRSPLTLLLRKKLGSRQLASKVEYLFKRLPKAGKERIIGSPEFLDKLVRKAEEHGATGKPVRKRFTNVLFVCRGNTCRSPMAKVIFEQMHLQEIAEGKINVDSAAYDGIPSNKASPGARKAINRLYGQDLLGAHVPKKLSKDLIDWADIIVVMTERMKKGLPAAKTRTLKEYAGETGDISDPYMQGDEAYLQCANEIKRLIEIAFLD
jgi:putative endonuclease